MSTIERMTITMPADMVAVIKAAVEQEASVFSGAEVVCV